MQGPWGQKTFIFPLVLYQIDVYITKNAQERLSGSKKGPIALVYVEMPLVTLYIGQVVH